MVRPLTVVLGIMTFIPVLVQGGSLLVIATVSEKAPPAPEMLGAVVWRGEEPPRWLKPAADSHRELLRFQHECREGDHVVVSGAGLVGGPVPLEPRDHCSAGSSVGVELRPGTIVTGRVEVEGGRLPSWGWIEVEGCPMGREPPWTRGRYPFPVADDGGFAVGLPIGCMRWRLGSPGLWSAARPDLHLVMGRDEEIGTVTLRPAGRVAVEVRELSLGAPLAGAAVHIVPEAQVDEVCGPDGDLRVERYSTAKTGISGWVEFPTVAPGTYLLVTTSEELAPGLGPLVEVAAGETSSTTVAVGSPGGLLVEMSDLVFLARPGSTWWVEAAPLLAGSEFSSCVHRKGFAPGSPAVALEGLAPGRWRVGLNLDRGWGRATVASAEVDVPWGTMVEAVLDLSGKVVHGRMEYRREGVQADMILMVRKAHSRSKVGQETTREDGTFMMLLDEPGRYDVVVTASNPSITTTVPAVDFPCDGSEVVIRIPQGLAAGRVVDADGHPASRASVGALWIGGDRDDMDREMIQASARTDEMGAFEMEGLVAGRWEVSAREFAKDGTRRSDTVVVSLEPGGEARDVILVLRDPQTLRGRVVTQAGRPVGGALVAAGFPPSASGSPGEFAITRADASGSFEIATGPTIPPSVNLQVGSPPLPTVALRVPTTDEVVVTLPELGGMLHLAWPPGGTDRRPPIQEIALVSEQGGVIGPTTLPLRRLPATAEHPEPGIDIGPLAPGIWRVLWARIQPGVVEALWAGGGGLPVVSVVNLSPGSMIWVEE